MKHTTLFTALLLTVLSAAHAGRPLIVDNANVNEKGYKHVETWFEKTADDQALVISPSYALRSGLEVNATLRTSFNSTPNLLGFGAKYQLTKPVDVGCYSAIALGTAFGSGSNAIGFNLIGTCKLGGPDLHINLGAARNTSTKDNTRALGIALEKEYAFGTGHVEAVAEQGNKPLFQVGARTQYTPKLQLDGSIGFQGGKSRFSLGSKYQF